jgi:CRISPR/Cas system CMR-associated protein Cmr5 small subunit
MKGVIAYGITNTIDNDEMKSLNKMLFNLLPADVFKDLPQFQQVQIAASQQISQLQMQNKQLQDSVQSLTNQLNALSVNNQVNIVTKKLDNENKIQLKAMEIESKNDIKNKDISYNVAKAQKESELAEKQLQLQTVKAQIEAKKVQNDTIDTKLNLLKGFIK